MAGYIGTKAVALSTTTGNILGDMTVGGTTDVGTLEFNSLSGTGSVTITDILDEDNLASNSATKLATQQSIKAYVDSQIDTVDTLAEILAVGNRTSGAGKIEFRDAAIYLNSSADGQLDIVADTEIQIAATTVDLNGNLDVSGTGLVTGVLTTTAATVFNGGFASNANSTVGGTLITTGNMSISETGANNEKSITIANSSANSMIGVEGSSGNRFVGSAANNMFMGTTSADGIEFATNNTVRANIAADGSATFNAEAAAPSFKATDFINIQNDDAEIYLTNAANNRYFRMRRDNTHNDIDMSFYNGSSTTNKFKFRASGDFELADGDIVVGTAGHGINFSNYGTGTNIDNNLLNDYEEGTWTIAFSGANVSGNTTAFYTKIGNFVYFNFYSGAANITNASGSLSFGGLPFAARNIASGYSIFSTQHQTFFNDVDVDGGYIAIGGTNAFFVKRNTATGIHVPNGNSKYVMLSGMYQTDS